MPPSDFAQRPGVERAPDQRGRRLHDVGDVESDSRLPREGESVLDDADEEVRLEAISALRRLGQGVAAPATESIRARLASDTA